MNDIQAQPTPIERIKAKIGFLQPFYKSRRFSLKGEVAFSYRCDSCGGDGISIPRPGIESVPPKYCGYCGTKLSPHSNIESHSLNKILHLHA